MCHAHWQLRGKNPATVATVTNKGGAIAGDADFYAWGLEGTKTHGKAGNDVRAVGVQSFPCGRRLSSSWSSL